MSNTISYDPRKTLDDNLRAAGVEPAEFMEEYKKWCSSIILIEMGVKVPLVGGAKMGMVALGLGVIGAGVAVAMFIATAPATSTIGILTAVATDVCVAKAGWFAPVAVDAVQCAIATQAVQAATAQAMQLAIGTGTTICGSGLGLLIKGMNDERVTFDADEATNKTLKLVENYTKSQAAASKAATLSLLQTQTMRNTKNFDNADLILQSAKVGATTIAAGAAGGLAGAAAAAGVGVSNILQKERVKARARGNQVLGYLNQQRQQQQEEEQQQQQGGARNSAKITEAALLMSGVSLDIAKKVASSIKTQNGSSRTRKNYRKN